jgi:hypothetical protein
MLSESRRCLTLNELSRNAYIGRRPVTGSNVEFPQNDKQQLNDANTAGSGKSRHALFAVAINRARSTTGISFQHRAELSTAADRLTAVGYFQHGQIWQRPVSRRLRRRARRPVPGITPATTARRDPSRRQ